MTAVRGHHSSRATSVQKCPPQHRSNWCPSRYVPFSTKWSPLHLIQAKGKCPSTWPRAPRPTYPISINYPETKKGQIPVSPILDELGFVQKVCLGMTYSLCAKSCLKVELGFFFNYVSRNRGRWLPTLCKCLRQAMKNISDGNKGEKVAFELRADSSQMI